jgi:hypothetical protein
LVVTTGYSTHLGGAGSDQPPFSLRSFSSCSADVIVDARSRPRGFAYAPGRGALGRGVSGGAVLFRCTRGSAGRLLMGRRGLAACLGLRRWPDASCPFGRSEGGGAPLMVKGFSSPYQACVEFVKISADGSRRARMLIRILADVLLAEAMSFSRNVMARRGHIQLWMCLERRQHMGGGR